MYCAMGMGPRGASYVGSLSLYWRFHCMQTAILADPLWASCPGPQALFLLVLIAEFKTSDLTSDPACESS